MIAIATVEQLAVITTESYQAMVVACPGSGKTEVIVQRVIHLVINDDCDPADIAVVTYTNGAARVVAARLSENGIEVGYVGTLHGFCLRHLASFGPWINLRVMDEEDADALLVKSAVETGSQLWGNGKAVTWSQITACRSAWTGQEPKTPVEIAVAHYNQRMVTTGEVDYDTLLQWTLKLLSELTTPRRRWAHLIVDEYQDAASIDAAIYEAAEADNRFFVGDPMQSIFAFRGSNVGEIERLVADPSWDKYQLTTNFRSLPAICNALNNLASKANGAPQKPVVSFAEAGGDVFTRYFDDDAEEAEGIALGIQHLIEKAGPDQTADALIAAASQIAVLARNNKIADRIAEEMKLKGVPVCQLKKLEQPKDWKLAMAALGVLARPKSVAAKRRYFEKSGQTAPKGLTGRADWMASELADLGAGVESVARILKRFGELPTTADLRDLELSLTLDPASRQMEGEGCFVGTIHSAKGQEWDTVVVAAFEDEVIPGMRQDTDINEERRLAYVAMSRARVRLTLSWAAFRARFNGGHLCPQNLSRFAEEAGQ